MLNYNKNNTESLNFEEVCPVIIGNTLAFQPNKPTKQDVFNLINQAQLYINHRPDIALEILKLEEKTKIENSDLHLLTGGSYLKKNNVTKGMEHLKEERRLFPENKNLATICESLNISI